jgi:hypothetical protein
VSLQLSAGSGKFHLVNRIAEKLQTANQKLPTDFLYCPIKKG